MTFVRTSGFNLGKSKLAGDELDSNSVEEIAGLIADKDVQHLHCWSRNIGMLDDEVLLNFMDQQPEGVPDFARSIAKRFDLKLNQQASNNQWVLDLIEVEPDSIFYSCHQVTSPQQSWPGGVIRFQRPDRLISRAYLKTREAMIWSRFPFGRDEASVEIGCAPGGSALALLESGMKVIGIDPADVDEAISTHPNFVHIKKRGSDVRKKQLGDAKWLFADSNVAPQYTLDTAEDIATNQHVHLKGMILTLKLLDLKLVADIDRFRQRVLEMGFQYVKTRQLAFNRNEICLAALKRKSLLRFGRQKQKSESEKMSKD